MTKKIISAVLAVTFIMSAIFMLGGCTNRLEDNEIEKIYNNALKATLEQDVYFLKETINYKDAVKYTQVNVRASIDKKYNIERNEDGSYKDYRIEAFEQLNGKETVRKVCGISGGDSKSFLFTTTYDSKDNAALSKKEMTSKDYYNSEEFAKYRIETFFDELNYLKFSDMDFNIEKSEAKTSGEVTSLIFAPKKRIILKDTSRKRAKPRFLTAVYESRLKFPTASSLTSSFIKRTLSPAAPFRWKLKATSLW